MKFQKEYTIGAREMGVSNKLTNYGILAFLEDIAICHSDTVGFGVKDIETKNRAWLLMDWYLEVKQRPKFSEKLITKTWATKIEAPTHKVYRDFEILNSNGELVANATSKWILFDVEAQKITKIDNTIIDLYKPEGNDKWAIQNLSKLSEPKEYEKVISYKVNRFDIDINKHVHNLNYINIAYEVLPENVYNNEELKHVHIMYKHQIKFGEIVKCLYNFQDNKHLIAIKSEDEKTLHAIVELW